MPARPARPCGSTAHARAKAEEAAEDALAPTVGVTPVDQGGGQQGPREEERLHGQLDAERRVGVGARSDGAVREDERDPAQAGSASSGMLSSTSPPPSGSTSRRSSSRS
ncbi:hypothetical protein C5C00_11720 [Rathayibacter rathayi]|nr:hypothetical protein C5C47_13080 [Rathayibacter rathayi]PPG94660.1 hypothetical protein C5C00_11720 [Rathayibacter rathayi]